MSVYPIKTFDGDGGGLDFAEFWDDPVLVAATVTQFSAHLQSAKCYCMRLNPVHGTRDSTFFPYGDSGLPSHPVGSLPTIEFYRLLLDDEKTWPVLGRWVPGGLPSKHPEEIASAKWHGEVRVKRHYDYVGFIKAVLPEPVHDDLFHIAYREVKRWLDRKVAMLRLKAVWRSADARASLQNTRLLINRDLKAGRRSAAVQRLAALITSHVGTGFNRIACLLPAEKDTLQCVHAHGGDCSADWARRVQDPLVRDATSPDQLQARVELRIPPIDDPVYNELVATGPLRVQQDSTSLIGQVWKDKGKLDGLPEQNQVLDEPDVNFSEDGNVVLGGPYWHTLAARFNLRERWVTSCFPEQPGSALYASKNGIIFVLPWTLAGRLVGLWLLELGQWSRFDERRDVVPRLRSAKEILEELSTTFRNYV